MEAIGIIKIDKGLTLTNPKMKILFIGYDQVKNTVVVHCEFIDSEMIEGVSRYFEFENITGEDLVYNDVIGLINNHEILKQFKK